MYFAVYSNALLCILISMLLACRTSVSDKGSSSAFQSSPTDGTNRQSRLVFDEMEIVLSNFSHHKVSITAEATKLNENTLKENFEKLKLVISNPLIRDQKPAMRLLLATSGEAHVSQTDSIGVNVTQEQSKLIAFIDWATKRSAYMNYAEARLFNLTGLKVTISPSARADLIEANFESIVRALSDLQVKQLAPSLMLKTSGEHQFGSTYLNLNVTLASDSLNHFITTSTPKLIARLKFLEDAGRTLSALSRRVVYFNDYSSTAEISSNWTKLERVFSSAKFALIPTDISFQVGTSGANRRAKEYLYMNATLTEETLIQFIESAAL